ncbi:MAG: head GIN domain-containing protein [Saprospiraceae bacterium]|nr:head GIN domain-containing protein [Saprospiraceae bacterium]
MRNLLLFMAAVGLFVFGWRYLGCLTGVTGQGIVVGETRPLEPIKGVSVSGGGELTIVRGEVSQIAIEAQQNILDRIKTEVRDGVLHIWVDGPVRNAKIQYRVEMPELRSLSLSGGVNGAVKTPFEGEQAEVDLSGGCRLNFPQMFYGTARMDLSGGTFAEVGGQVEALDANLSGGGRMQGFNLITRRCRAVASGGAHLECNVTDELDVNISGGGRVEYKGSPSVKQVVSGGGRIVAVDPG